MLSMDWWKWFLAGLFVVALTMYAADFQLREGRDLKGVREVTIFLDNSTSMLRQEQNHQSLLDQARGDIKEYIRRLPVSAHWKVVVTAPEPNVLVEGTGGDIGNEKAFREMRVFSQERVSKKTLRTATNRERENASRSSEVSTGRKVMFLSDGQGLKPNRFRDAFSGNDLQLQMVQYGSPTQNVAITDGKLRLENGRNTLNLEVTVQNFSDRSNRSDWTLYAGGKTVREGEVILEPGERRTVSVEQERIILSALDDPVTRDEMSSPEAGSDVLEHRTGFFTAESPGKNSSNDREMNDSGSIPLSIDPRRLLMFSLHEGGSFPRDDTAYFLLPPRRQFGIIETDQSKRRALFRAVDAFFGYHVIRVVDRDQCCGLDEENGGNWIWMMDAVDRAPFRQIALPFEKTLGILRFDASQNGRGKSDLAQDLEQVWMSTNSGLARQVYLGELSIQKSRIFEISPDRLQAGFSVQQLDVQENRIFTTSDMRLTADSLRFEDLAGKGKGMGQEGTAAKGIVRSKHGWVGRFFYRNETPVVGLGFSLKDSNFSSLPAFPIFIRNSINMIYRYFEKRQYGMSEIGHNLPERIQTSVRLNRHSGNNKQQSGSRGEWMVGSFAGKAPVVPGFYGSHQEPSVYAVNMFSARESRMHRELPESLGRELRNKQKLSGFYEIPNELWLVIALGILLFYWSDVGIGGIWKEKLQQ